VRGGKKCAPLLAPLAPMYSDRMGQLKLRGIVASREMEAVLLSSTARLFPSAWVVEITETAARTQPPLVGVIVSVRDGRSVDMGNSHFQANRLEDVPPFLETVAKVARGKRLF
jgi:hypothetical protein